MNRLTRFFLRILGLPFKKGEMGGQGQVAIFAALIFQVLFIFFAMVVNVGLLVHHKINLQNSVDLSAYYGAMKQAEVMNAIAHVNYQIRQSWKLMTFRYRGIGMAGNEKGDAPFNRQSGSLGAGASSDAPYSCPASFCANYSDWSFMNVNENYCKDMCEGVSITLPGQPFGSSKLAGLLMAALPGITAAVDAISAQATQEIIGQCKKKSALTWFILGRYVFAFKNDVANRKRIINKLANSISSSTTDLQDIDGESVRTGALNTFWKNLTYQNQASIDPKTGTGNGKFDFFNSLAAGNCGGTANDEGTPPKWLSEQFVKPLYGFLDGLCDGTGGHVNYKIKILNANDQENTPNAIDELDPAVVDFLKNYIRDPLTFDSAEARLYHTTVGYEKNPWCAAYVRVNAQTKPKIPFSPFSGVTLTASSYAKPFGGKIGPWFYRTWAAGADSSKGSRADQIDKALPDRVYPGTQNVNANDDFLRVDYARYTGDEIGNKSTLTMGHMHQAIHNKASAAKLSIGWWTHLLDGSSDVNAPNNPGDILAWNNGSAPPIRALEIGSVIPDQFDVTNYSIEPNFWRMYAQRIQKRADFSNINIRGDLGYRKDGSGAMPSYSVKDQIAESLNDNSLDYTGSLTYYAGHGQAPATAFTEVLTGWHNKKPGDYNLAPERFGKCFPGGIIDGAPNEVDKASPGNCMGGGRTGYSVKLVDPSLLSGDQEIGGQGQTGRIKNPPP